MGLDADAGGRLLVFGQKMREAICCSFLVQAERDRFLSHWGSKEASTLVTG